MNHLVEISLQGPGGFPKWDTIYYHIVYKHTHKTVQFNSVVLKFDKSRGQPTSNNINGYNDSPINFFPNVISFIVRISCGMISSVQNVQEADIRGCCIIEDSLLDADKPLTTGSTLFSEQYHRALASIQYIKVSHVKQQWRRQFYG